MMGLSKKQRQQVWEKSDGHCWYCGCDLPEKGWHADHVEPVIRETEYSHPPDNPLGSYEFRSTGKTIKPENDRLENIVPACAPCNLFKTTHPLEGFREEIEAQADRLPKSSSAFRIAERFGIVSVKTKPVKFWFEENRS